MATISIPCKKCKLVKQHRTSYLDAPIKFMFFCENEKCRTPNGVVLKFASESELKIQGQFDVAASPLPLVDLTPEDTSVVDDLAELVE